MSQPLARDVNNMAAHLCAHVIYEMLVLLVGSRGSHRRASLHTSMKRCQAAYDRAMVWSIRTKLQIEGKKRDLALFKTWRSTASCSAATWSPFRSMTWAPRSRDS